MKKIVGTSKNRCFDIARCEKPPLCIDLNSAATVKRWVFRSALVVFSIVLLLLCSASVFGQMHFGLGIIAGQPTGLTAKLWLTPQTSIDAAVAWSFLDEGALYIHTDLQYYGFRLGGFGLGGIGLYVGLGGRYLFTESFRLGVRLPVGLIYVFRNVPLDLFIEGAPAIELIPATELTGGGAIGMRYYF